MNAALPLPALQGILAVPGRCVFIGNSQGEQRTAAAGRLTIEVVVPIPGLRGRA